MNATDSNPGPSLDLRQESLFQNPNADHRKKILLIGNSKQTLEIAANVNKLSRDYFVVGSMRLNNRQAGPELPMANLPILGDLSEMVMFMELIPLNLTAIVIADPEIRHHQVLRVIALARKCKVELWTVPQLANAFFGKMKFFSFYGHPVIKLNDNRISRLKLASKTVFDYILGGIGLLLTLPIMAVAAVLIKLTSDGPVLFRQTRVGRNGKLFKLIKFRSMYVDAEERSGPVLSSGDNDQRVTPLGRILRKTHVDELPQFFNVINGTMSIVGPRPERPYFIEGFAQYIPFYSDRMAIKPGITGLAQLYGSYHSKAEEKLIFDLNYIHNMNLWVDIKTIFLTAWEAVMSAF